MVSRHLRKLQKLYNNTNRSVHSASLGTTETTAQLPQSFVFDIDGVLLRGKRVLPQAIRALKQLYHGDKPKLPLAFLTNGGGVTERRKAAQLSNLLQVPVTTQQVVLSHTPFRPLAAKYADEPVLVVGRGNILDVAKSYGFRKTVTTHQLAKSSPAAVPFWKEQTQSLFPLRYGIPAAPIRAVFVFADPTDWYVDLQLVTDILVGGGVLGRRKEEVPSDQPPVEIFFSNPDLLWANEFNSPRFGQGAFATCIEALHASMNDGRPLPAKTVFGKPNPEPYRLVEKLLTEQAEDLGVLPKKEARHEELDREGLALPPFSAIYAVGDNSAADIRGANEAGHPWVSILVRTGVFSGPHPNCPDHPATIVVDDVEAAVHAALHHSRSMKWHAMR